MDGTLNMMELIILNLSLLAYLGAATCAALYMGRQQTHVIPYLRAFSTSGVCLQLLLLIILSARWQQFPVTSLSMTLILLTMLLTGVGIKMIDHPIHTP